MTSFLDLPILFIVPWLNVKDNLALLSTCKTLFRLIQRPFRLYFVAYKQSIKYIPKKQRNLYIELEAYKGQITSHEFLYLAKRGHYDTLRLLKENQFSLETLQQAYELCVQHIHPFHGKIAFELVSYNISNPFANNSLNNAAKFGNPDLVEFLVNDPRVDISKDDFLAIRIAAKYGRPSCLKALINHPKAEPHALDNEAIRISSTNGHVKCVKLLLLNSKVSPEAKNNEAVISATRNGHFLIVLLLVNDKRVNVFDQNHRAFYEAYSRGHKEIVYHLFMMSLKIMDGFTLKFACLTGDLQIVQELLKKPRITPSYEAFRLACKEGHLSIAKALIEDKRIDVNLFVKQISAELSRKDKRDHANEKRAPVLEFLKCKIENEV
jgi:ankyrin repeat protein